MVAIIQAARLDMARWEPVFWRASPDQTRWTQRFFGLLWLLRSVMLIAERDGRPVGFLIARGIRPSPVFAPEGKSVLVDDFYVDRSKEWADAGAALLDALRPIAAQRGWRQLIVICPVADEPKAALLRTAALGPVSTWWVGQA